MGRLPLYTLLLLPLLRGLAQSYPPENGTPAKDPPIRSYFDHLSVEDGLSNNSVNCLLQDREGFMWFGTNDGLNKYDGYAFTALKPNQDDTVHSFRNNQVSGLCEDHQNRLWVATLGGLHEVDKATSFSVA